MSDWSKPTLASTYTNFVAEVNAKFSDLAVGSDPALTTQTSTPTGATRWNSASAFWEKYNGTSWTTLSASYAISISGSAAKWTTARSIALTGDATGLGSIDGTANLSLVTTLANTGVAAAQYGGVNSIPVITVDAKGRVTALSTATISSDWSGVTNKPTTLAGFAITDGVRNAGSAPSIQSGLASARPAAGTLGAIWISTDTGVVQRDTSSTWETMVPAFTGDVTTSAKNTALTLSTVNSNVGSYGGNNSIPNFTVDAKGRISVAGATTPSGSWNINAATATNVAYTGLTGGVPVWNQSTTGNASTASSCSGNSATASSCSGNSLTASSCTGNSATASSCSGNSATATNATTATNLSGGSVSATTITATGDITAFYSDDRLKTRTGCIENALEKVKSLDTFYYHANETAQALGYAVREEVGVSAQQVQAVMPQVVAPAPIDAQYLTVRYEKLVPLLIAAIKELEVRLSTYESVKVA